MHVEELRRVLGEAVFPEQVRVAGSRGLDPPPAAALSKHLFGHA